MRILFATPWAFPEGGGLERYARTMAERVARAGHDVTLVAHSRRGRRDAVEDGVRILTLPPRLRLSNSPLHPFFHARVRRLLRDERFDVVNGHAPVPGAAEMAFLAARREGVPFVLTYHAGTLTSALGALRVPAALHRATLERWMISEAAGRIAVSPFVAENVFRAHRSALVPPGVDAARFHPAGKPDPGRILFVGPVSRAYTWKGLAVLFDAFERVARAYPEASLRIVGEGDLVPEYAARAKRVGLAKRVAFAGRVKESALPHEYAKAAVVVLPSLTDAESFGMVLAEANACGRPVIGANVGGVASFVWDGDNGLLVPPGEAHALAVALARLLASPEEASRMGERGRARVVADHDWDGLARRTIACFEEAAGARRERPTGASSRASRRTTT